MLKILQARLQQYMKQELPDVQAGFRKAEKPEFKLPAFTRSWRKQENFRKASTSASLTTLNFDCVAHNKLWYFLQEMGVPGHLTYLLKHLYVCQEATVRTRHGTNNQLNIEKGIQLGWIFSSWWLNLDAEYIRQNARLNVLQAGIKIAGRNINNLSKWYHSKGRKWRGTKMPLDEDERRDGKS